MRSAFFFVEKMGSSKQKTKMGSAHFLAVPILGAHDPYIPTKLTLGKYIGAGYFFFHEKTILVHPQNDI